MKDLHILPKVRDGWSHLYVEHCRLDKEDKAIVLHDERGKVSVPCATLSVIMLGPGTSITHAAITALADNGCLALWCGEAGVRFYAEGMGETRNAANLMHQARLWANPVHRLEVVLRMYQLRFGERLQPGLTLRQIRGKEGARVRDLYAAMSKHHGVEWTGRSYKRESWSMADPINRALSAADSCLYGVCHAAIVSAGYSPALGFIHTGKMLSFVYDIADLYKTEFSIPVAFAETARGTPKLESRVRHAMRDRFNERRLLQRIIPDLQKLLAIPVAPDEIDFDSDQALPGSLWDPESLAETGGLNYAEEVDHLDRDGAGASSDGTEG